MITKTFHSPFHMNPEAQRCLLCRRPLCREACPVRTDVPSFMSLYREGRLQEAREGLFANNPFSAVTCQVCDYQQFCFGHCVLNRKKLAIRWYEIERELSMPYILGDDVSVPVGEPTGKKVAIVGAGPAGITAALGLRALGHGVDVYDAMPLPGGVLRYGIPSFRLEDKYVDAYGRLMEKAGARFHGSVRVGKDITLSELRDADDAVIICAGAWVPRKLNIPGEEGNPSVIYALDYLASPSSFQLGHRVLVIGGGNVTMDASRTAVRAGHDTTVVYRKTFENMPAGYEEVQGARNDGVKFNVFSVPVSMRIQETDEGEKYFTTLRRCENYYREDGTIATRMIDGADTEVPYDTMIVAISERPDSGILAGASPDELEDVFVCGDYLTGPATVVEAVKGAKQTVADVEAFLGGNNPRDL